MMPQNLPTNKRVESAARLNKSLADQIARARNVRLTFAVVLGAAAISLTFVQELALLSVPCSIAAAIAYLLYLDARDQLQDVQARNWISPTPRIARVEKRQPDEPSDSISRRQP